VEKYFTLSSLRPTPSAGRQAKPAALFKGVGERE